jgi:hypothetical protein
MQARKKKPMNMEDLDFLTNPKLASFQDPSGAQLPHLLFFVRQTFDSTCNLYKRKQVVKRAPRGSRLEPIN